MSDAPEPKATYASLLKYPLIQIPLVIGAVLGILTQGVVAYKDTQEAIQLQAQANNARLKEGAEAERIDAQATTALEQAKNAVQRAKSEADTLVAEADKIEAEAITLREKATNAATVARAEATKAYYEAIKEQQNLRIEIAKLRNIATKEKGEVEQLETKNALIRSVIIEQIKKMRVGWMNYFFGGR
jgi:hypothetical protein